MSKLKIGIDPGTDTGLAISADGRLVKLYTVKIIKAMEIIEQTLLTRWDDIIVVIEDARLRGGKKERSQGAGSIKRDCVIWQEFWEDYSELENLCVLYQRPGKSPTKMDEDLFKKMTGWTKRTSNHARDAAMLIHGL